MRYITNLQIQNDENGRFGNQLFRIATTFAAAKENNINFLFPNWKHSLYFESENLFSSTNIYVDGVYTEKTFGYDKIPILSNNLEIRGYFQSEKYFQNHKEEVKNLFKFKPEFITLADQKINIRKNSCSIHFRHGDQYDRETGGAYIDCQDRHPIMTPLYYQRSIQYMKNLGVDCFYLFYDHLLTKKWIQENITELDNVNHHFVDEKITDIESFYLMSKCDHNIIANSTFSWWAAWLNNNTEKKVLSPKNEEWFGATLSHLETRDLIPEQWLKIKNF